MFCVYRETRQWYLSGMFWAAFRMIVQLLHRRISPHICVLYVYCIWLMSMALPLRIVLLWMNFGYMSPCMHSDSTHSVFLYYPAHCSPQCTLLLVWLLSVGKARQCITAEATFVVTCLSVISTNYVVPINLCAKVWFICYLVHIVLLYSCTLFQGALVGALHCRISICDMVFWWWD